MAEISQNFEKRPHIKKFERIPKCYKEAVKVLKQVKTCQGNLKTIMFHSRLQRAILKRVYGLVANVLRNWQILEKVYEDTHIFLKEPHLKKEVAVILIYETIFGKGSLPGESKPIQTIRKYEQEIKESYKIAKKDVNLSSICPSLPRYARVNTITTTVSAVLEDLRNNGFQQVTYDKNTSLDGYMNLVKSLQVGYFLIDFHFKDLLVFASIENLTKCYLYERGQICIQDKSSYIPVHALNPKPGDTVLDACAAPGMKTVHIAAAMKNKGKIYAYEKDKYRFKTLKDTLDFANVTMCEADCKDFYSVYSEDPKFHSLECILVDPSCSGSGMVSRMDSVTDTEDSKNKLRLQKLAGFQILLLKHALMFPSVKRVVYSTCSVTEEENEFVVHEVLNKFSHTFKLVSVMPDWPIRGSDNFEYGHLCLRANSSESLTNGFFVAMFERLECGIDQSFPLYDNLSGSSKWSKRDKKRKYGGDNFEASNSMQNENEKKHKNKHHSEDQVPELIEGLNNVIEKVKELKCENDVIINATKKDHDNKNKEVFLDKNMDEANGNFFAIKIAADLEEKAVKKKHKKKKHNHKDLERVTKENFINVFENTIVNELDCNATKRKHKKKKNNPRDQEIILEENCIDSSEITIGNETEFNTIKKHKRKRDHSENQILDGNTLRLKMDEDIENEKKLYKKNKDVEVPSDSITPKKHKRKKHKDSIEEIDADSSKLHKKQKSQEISFSDTIVSEDGNKNSEMCLKSPPMTDLHSKKKHKKKCKDKKKEEE